MTDNDCVVNVEPTTEDYEEMGYIMCLMDLHRYVVTKGHQRVIDDLNRLIAAQSHEVGPSEQPPGWPEGAVFTDMQGGYYDENARPLEPYSRASHPETIDQEEQLSYDPRHFGGDYDD